jgi:hypothetical protein
MTYLDSTTQQMLRERDAKGGNAVIMVCLISLSAGAVGFVAGWWMHMMGEGMKKMTTKKKRVVAERKSSVQERLFLALEMSRTNTTSLGDALRSIATSIEAGYMSGEGWAIARVVISGRKQ